MQYKCENCGAQVSSNEYCSYCGVKHEVKTTAHTDVTASGTKVSGSAPTTVVTTTQNGMQITKRGFWSGLFYGFGRMLLFMFFFGGHGGRGRHR